MCFDGFNKKNQYQDSLGGWCLHQLRPTAAGKTDLDTLHPRCPSHVSKDAGEASGCWVGTGVLQRTELEIVGRKLTWYVPGALLGVGVKDR